MFFIAYTFEGQVHVFAGRVKIASHSSCRTSENCKSLVLQDKYNIEIFLSPEQCGILTSVESVEPVQPPFKLRNSK